MIKLLSVAIVAGLVFESNQRKLALSVVKPVPAKCWTDWFDRDNPSGTGDWETLSDLRTENPGKICPKPFGIEATTLTGVSVAAAGDVIFKIDTSTGFVCRTQDQKFKKQCNDYRVRFSCPPEFCKAPPAVCWTKWYNRDSPSGTGDWEVLSNLRAENPGEICDNPTSIEAVTTDTLTPAISTGENFFAYNPTVGFVCRIQDQKSGRCRNYKVRFGCPCPIDTSTGFVCRTQDQKPKKQCRDYRVRFSCPPEFCKAPPAVCWTKWYNRDSPGGTGDWEVLSNLRAENPGEICDNPTSIEAVTTDTLTPAISTGENFFAYNPTVGFVCRIQDQKSGRCRNYKVRFGCPCP